MEETLWILNANKKKRELEQNGVNKILFKVFEELGYVIN